MMYHDAMERVRGQDGLTAYVFDDRTVSTESDNADDLRAIIGALLIERERKPHKRRWWQWRGSN